MSVIPFLRPSLPPWPAYREHLERIDATHLYSNFGPLNTAFEARVLDEYFQGSGAAVTVANATLGLMLALSETRRPGARYALMPSFTFAATPLAAQWCGLEPYFVDVDPGTWCLDPKALDAALEALGDQVAAVVPYAAFGTAMDLAPWAELHRRGIPVVIDAAPGFGATDDRGTFGQDFPGLVVFSLHATKTFGIGEGGLVYGGDAGLVARIRSGANFGFASGRESMHLGLNAKLSEYAAAVALAALDAHPDGLRERQCIHEWYLEELDPLWGAGWQIQAHRGRVPWQFMSVLCPAIGEGPTRDERLAALSSAGVEARTYFAPACHAMAQFAACPRGDLAVTEQLSARILSLPLWEGMARADVARVVRGLAP